MSSKSSKTNMSCFSSMVTSFFATFYYIGKVNANAAFGFEVIYLQIWTSKRPSDEF